MKKLSVCVLFGGISPEHEVSLRSAEAVLNNMDSSKYHILPVGITKSGDWILFGGTDYAMLPDGTWQEHPDWEENLALGLKLHTQCQRISPGIMRYVNLQAQRFNQDLSPGALIVEIGAAGNTHAEALTATEVLAEAILSLANGTGVP